MRRGVSINVTANSLDWKGHVLNLLDTPGDFDYLGEQMLGLYVGDAVVIILSAKDGLAVGAEKALRLAQKQNRPVVFFVNRIDEANADFMKTLNELTERFGSKVVPFTLPIMAGESFEGVTDVLKKKAVKLGDKGVESEIDVPAEYVEQVEQYHDQLQEQIAESDETLMEKFFEGEPFTEEEEEAGIKGAVLTGSIWPVFVGSATLNKGVAYALDRMVRYLPSPLDVGSHPAKNENDEDVDIAPDKDDPLAALVFKTIVDPFVGRISLFRVYAGTFPSSGQIYNAQKEKDERIGGIFRLRGKKQVSVDSFVAGDIGAVSKFNETNTGDTLCDRSRIVRLKTVDLPKPALTLAISPAVKGEEDKIMQGLTRLKEEDPVFEIVNDPETHQLLLSGLGETQLDVLSAKLKARYGVEARLSEAKVPYRETIRKKVKVQGKHKKQSGGHGQYGDVWIEFEPGETEALDFSEKIFGGSVPKNYHPAVEKGLIDAIEKGVLAGYPVVNLKATLVDGSYHDVDSNEMSFRLAARLAYRNGLPQANPILLEPISAVHVHIPDDYLGDVMGDLNKRRGRILGVNPDKDQGFTVVEAEVPSSELGRYATDLKSMAQGRGWHTVQFARYEPAPSDVSERVIAAATREEEE
jgi:elongation factor G